jgi:hypothetical protein
MRLKAYREILVLVASAALAACGGGGSDVSGPGSPPQVPNFVTLQSDFGDFIGAGQTYSYTQANSQISFVASGAHLGVSVSGDQNWFADFQGPSGQTQLQPGTYGNLQRYPFHDPAKGGMSWSGEGRGCNTLAASVFIDKVVYSNDVLTAIDLRFEQHCEGAAPALRGQIHWQANDTTAPPGPIDPPPAGLWQPAPGSTPSSGNYVYLQSEFGDFIGAGGTHSYTQANAQLTVGSSNGHVSVSVNGDESWSGNFQAMIGTSQVRPGYYGGLKRWPFHNPVKGGLDWSGEGRGCNTLTGWFVVDNVTYLNGVLTAIDLRFEQHCEGGAPALHGQIHWQANDSTMPPGPVNPPPAGLWQPAPGSTPASGNYVYLESQPGDFIGQGQTFTYTKANAQLSISGSGGHFAISVNGNEFWSGDFQAMSSIGQLQFGYYGDLQRYPFHNPVRGGLDWSGDGRGCNTLTGWFVVDSVTYASGILSAIDLRFEQHCEGGTPALHGQIHWQPNDTTPPPGPVSPPPAGLWQPAPGSTPASGNYVYLQSDPGDFVGAGLTRTYTQANALLSVSASVGHLSVGVSGDRNWFGDFQAMSNLSQLQFGYYGDLQRYPFHNPVKGGLDWFGDGRGCNTLTGWFVVDNVTYANNVLTAIDLRFEQHCEGGAPALHGQIHWRPNDTTAPPGPVNPPPPGLWQPAPGSTPASGNYVYLESQPGDFVGAGLTRTYTKADAQLSISGSGGHFAISVNGNEFWSGNFQTMSNLSQLQVGYYGDLQRWPFHSPVKGGLDWSGDGRGCNTLTGWFVVDSVTYANGILSAIDLRFEQHCEGGAPALHGQIHWQPNDTTAPPGPVNPPPAGLWQPAPGATPASGNYVYLQSDVGDFIGLGQTNTYTSANSQLSVNAPGGHLSITVNVPSANGFWSGDFQAMSSVAQLQLGYYGDLQRYPFHNPVKGGLSWSGMGRGCNTLTGWFVVDNVTYANNVLTAIDLRFEQHCDGGPALHGQIHWTQ